MIGALNNRLGTCVSVSGDNPCLVGFDPQMGSMANYLYQAGYFRVAALSLLQGGAQWNQLVEGDSKISRENTTNVVKYYQIAQKDAENNLTTAITYWNLNHTVPQGIDAVQLSSYPSP